MEYRFLGNTGLKVSALAFGAGTFGGRGPMFSAWGDTGLEEARSLVDICLDAGVNMFDTADIYSDGASETILGEALKGRRVHSIVSTKISLRTGPGPNDVGASRHHLIEATERALRRLGTDYIDILYLHQFDAMTQVESVLSTLDDLVSAGKVRYLGLSNFSGWQIMKSIAIAERYGWPRYVANQTYYSLIGRDYEWELMPLGLDQGISAVVWSPLGWGRLTGKLRPGVPLPESSRLHRTARWGPHVETERVHQIVGAIDKIAAEIGKTVAQIALNWLLRRPTVAALLIGARNKQQLLENLGASDWELSAEHMAILDSTSSVVPPYPYCHYWNGQFTERNPPPVNPEASLKVM